MHTPSRDKKRCEIACALASARLPHPDVLVASSAGANNKTGALKSARVPSRRRRRRRTKMRRCRPAGDPSLALSLHPAAAQRLLFNFPLFPKARRYYTHTHSLIHPLPPYYTKTKTSRQLFLSAAIGMMFNASAHRAHHSYKSERTCSPLGNYTRTLTRSLGPEALNWMVFA